MTPALIPAVPPALIPAVPPAVIPARLPGRGEQRGAHGHHDTSRTFAPLCGTTVAVISERWRFAENVTVSVCAPVLPVLTVKPRFGTAEIRQTASAPNRTVALPPSEGTV
ncbi:hypothetical protein [Streptomyces sp. NPDC004830]